MKSVLDEAKVPQRVHLQVIQALQRRMEEHSRDIHAHQKFVGKTEEDQLRHEAHDAETAKLLKEYRGEIERRKIEKGEKGKDAVSPKIEDIVAAVLPHIRQPEDGMDAIAPSLEEVVSALLPQIRKPKDGKPGLDAFEGEDGAAKLQAAALLIVKHIKDKQMLDLTHIKGAQKFIKDGVSYKMEELMHGGGSKSTGGFTILTVTGTIDDSNTSFSIVSKPTLVNINGSFYIGTGGNITWTYSGTTLTLSSPVGVGGSIFATG